MFSGIDTSRNWPYTGMTTEKWKQVPLFDVDTRRLIATQDGVYIKALMDTYTKSFSGDHYPHVISWRGRLYLEDGHHRAIKAMINGEKEIRARVLTIIDHGE